MTPARGNVRTFRAKIMRWFNAHGRTYPWRETSDPFKVLIAEMMLRRTKADQVRVVYEQLFEKYPDVKSLATAKSRNVEKILYPLGLKWRTPAFVLVAKELYERYQGRVPETRHELTTLTGVGEYVAGAVLSVAFGKKEWIVDSNIVRLFRRYFGIKTSKEGRRDKHVIELARAYASGRNPRKANLAILDISALICKPANPLCKKCPLEEGCHYASFQ